MSELVCFTSDQIRAVWPEVSPHLQRGLDRGSNYTLRDIYKGLRRQKMQLWTSRNDVIEAALVTSLQDGYCLLLCAGGSNADEWVHWLPVIERWAKEHGFNEMRLYGRIGWLRKLKGFRAVYTKMVKQL
ncbi:MAG: hypothetical protein HC808_10100 [Candidatus Competibacteraceae bacterium]|nr:hypothetical protein [Candidatus Competibacteraceae bacterium]